jgi:hypothetical protein
LTGSGNQMGREFTPRDRRRFPRFSCLPDASVGLQRGVRARLLNLGPGGALVESAMRLLPGSVTALRFDARAIALSKARISRAFVSGFARALKGEVAPLYRAGLEFEPLSASEIAALSAFISGAASPAPSLPEETPAAAGTAGPVSSTSNQAGRSVSIRFPPGWTLIWKKSAVVARAPNERGYVFLGSPQASPSGDLCEVACASMEAAGFSTLHCEPADINGLRACIGFYSGWLQDVGAALVEAAYVVLNNQAYLIAGVAPWASYEKVRHEFFATINSFGRLPAADDASILQSAATDPTDKFDFSSAFTLRMKIE